MKKYLLIPVLLLSTIPYCFSMHTSVDWLAKHVLLIDHVQEGEVDKVEALFTEGATVNIHALFGSWLAIPTINNRTVREYKPTHTLLPGNRYYHIWADYPETLLHIAARCGYTDMVRLLIEQATMEAVAKGNVDFLTTFLNQPDPRGFTALHLAAKNSHVPVAQALLKHMVNLLTRSRTNHTPREIALTMGNTAIAAMLLDAEQQQGHNEGNT
jgi:hypothetical protein